MKEIYQMTYDECADVLSEAKNRQKQIVQERWENKYKEMCGNEYIQLPEVFNMLNFYWKENVLGKLSDLEDYAYSNSHHGSLSSLIEELTNKGLEIKPMSDLANMICKACVCKSCTSCKESKNDTVETAIHCDGFSCTSCRKKNYRGYNFCCEE